MTSYARIGAVTGANKGIGLAIVRQLALQYAKSKFNDGPLLIYLTARNHERGEQALKDIHNDPKVKAAKALHRHGGLATVEFLKLDIESKDSIDNFARQLKHKHPDGIDFLINNAGIAMSGFDSNVVETTLRCNYYGTLETTTQLLPQIKDGGRLVNVASASGHLSRKYSRTIRNRFLSATKPAEITQLMEDFASAVANNRYHSDWPGAAYAVSKAGLIGATKCIANEQRAQGRSVLINSCCPGYVKTDMTKGGGMKTPDQGAQTPVMLAIGDIGGANGEFWQNEKATEW